MTVDGRKTTKAYDAMFVTNQVSNLNLDVDSDEFVEPINLIDQKEANLEENNFVILANFRADRICQLAHLIKQSADFNFSHTHYVNNVNLYSLLPIRKS